MAHPVADVLAARAIELGLTLPQPLASILVARADDAGLLDGGVRVQHGLDLGRPDFEARAVDHALQPVGDEEVALLVVVAEVAGAEEALAVVRDERLLARLGLLPVAAEHLGAVHHDLADLIWG